jgi:diacylglycerol O-acyltransferase
VLPLDDVRKVKESLHGTVNDVVLTTLCGALSRYVRSHQLGDPDSPVVRVLIPVSVRRESERSDLGNRVSFMLAGLPVEETDPRARFKAIHDQVAELKAIDQAGNMDWLGTVLGRTAPAFQSFLGTAMTMPNFVGDLVCTNVPGPRVPLYCMGHRMIAHYPWVPLAWRMGLGVAVMSYDQDLSFSLTADRSVLPDLETISDYIQEAFDELRRDVLRGQRPSRAEPVPALYASSGNDAHGDAG